MSLKFITMLIKMICYWSSEHFHPQGKSVNMMFSLKGEGEKSMTWSR